jgi:spore germination cell wall hydrolase CwlJ-like protein
VYFGTETLPLILEFIMKKVSKFIICTSILALAWGMPVNKPYSAAFKQIPYKISEIRANPPHKNIPVREHKILKTQSERFCLAQVMWFEARGEGEEGQIAVANVVFNRKDNDTYPRTICGVVHQGCQFSWFCDPHSVLDPGQLDDVIERLSWRQSQSLANKLIEEHNKNELEDTTDGAEFFFNYDVYHRTPKWAKEFTKTAKIGNHEFFKE